MSASAFIDRLTAVQEQSELVAEQSSEMVNQAAEWKATLPEDRAQDDRESIRRLGVTLQAWDLQRRQSMIVEAETSLSVSRQVAALRGEDYVRAVRTAAAILEAQVADMRATAAISEVLLEIEDRLLGGDD